MDRLAAMEVLVRVVETGSFSGAARQLRVGQPAVSKTIAQLEQHLGVSLLLRSSRGLTPTEAGQNFYERAKRSIEEAAAASSRRPGFGAMGRTNCRSASSASCRAGTPPTRRPSSAISACARAGVWRTRTSTSSTSYAGAWSYGDSLRDFHPRVPGGIR
jgi:Bacterial regulatory helix-turn-helix protein, lysR family